MIHQVIYLDYYWYWYFILSWLILLMLSFQKSIKAGDESWLRSSIYHRQVRVDWSLIPAGVYKPLLPGGSNNPANPLPSRNLRLHLLGTPSFRYLHYHVQRSLRWSQGGFQILISNTRKCFEISFSLHNKEKITEKLKWVLIFPLQGCWVGPRIVPTNLKFIKFQNSFTEEV